MNVMNGFMNAKKSKRAQQLVEFLLAVPFLIIIVGVMTEYAYALSIDSTVSQALKHSTASIYHQIRPGMTEADIDSLVLAEMRSYLLSHRIPVGTQNNLTVNRINADNLNVTMIATYRYVPAFSLPTVYIHILPEEFNFSSVVVVPQGLLSANDYGDVNNWQTTNSNLQSVWDDKAGILNAYADWVMNTAENMTAVDSINFFVDPEPAGAFDSYKRIDWQGHFIDEVDFSDYGDLPDDITNLIIFDGYIGGDFGGPVRPDDPWRDGCLAFPLSNANSICPLKDAISMNAIMTGSFGNYDNIDLTYNPYFINSTTYRVDTYGSKVIVHPNSKPVNASFFVNQPSNVDYDFGERVRYNQVP